MSKNWLNKESYTEQRSELSRVTLNSAWRNV